jgi:hypothetical protein
MSKRRAAAPYMEALAWIVLNDDTEWLDDENGSLSVSAALVADIYRRTDEEVTADLLKRREQLKGRGTA